MGPVWVTDCNFVTVPYWDLGASKPQPRTIQFRNRWSCGNPIPLKIYGVITGGYSRLYSKSVLSCHHERTFKDGTIYLQYVELEHHEVAISHKHENLEDSCGWSQQTEAQLHARWSLGRGNPQQAPVGYLHGKDAIVLYFRKSPCSRSNVPTKPNLDTPDVGDLT